MEGEAKTAKARAGAKAPAAKRSRARAATDKRTVEQRLADALAQQAATAEILRVMAASPTDVQPVLDAVAEQAARLCHAPYSRILLAEGSFMRPVANHAADGETPVPVHAVPLRRTTVTGRAVLDRKTNHVADIVPILDTEYPDARENAAESGFRALLAVPLIREGDGVWRHCPLAPRAWAVRARPGRLGGDLCHAGRDRHRERAAVPRHAGSTRAADGDRRNTAGNQQLADRRPAGIRRHRRQRLAPVRRAPQRPISLRWRTRFISPRSTT